MQQLIDNELNPEVALSSNVPLDHTRTFNIFMSVNLSFSILFQLYSFLHDH